MAGAGGCRSILNVRPEGLGRFEAPTVAPMKLAGSRRNSGGFLHL